MCKCTAGKNGRALKKGLISTQPLFAPYSPAESYSLLSNNCNNFSDELAQLLCGHSIPQHITGGVRGAMTALGC